MASVYQINKGINRPVVFKGVKAQYIAFLAVGMVLLLLGFVAGYVSGLSLYVLLPMVLVLGSMLFTGCPRIRCAMKPLTGK
jgi:hypothetical protein